MNLSVTKRLSPNRLETDDLVQFLWPRPPSLPRWESGRTTQRMAEEGWASADLAKLAAREKRFLTNDGGRLHYYRPLEEHPELFKVFADLDGSEKDFQFFAQVYGMLGLAVIDIDEADLGEPFAAWRLIWREIKTLAALLDAVHSPRAATAFDGMFLITDDVVTVNAPDPETGALASFGRTLLTRRPDTEPLWHYMVIAPVSERHRLRRLAGLFIQSRLSSWMGGRQLPEAAVFCTVGLDEKRDGWQTRMSPRTLAGALFLQVAQALEGGVKYRQCGGCRKWFVISTDRNLGRRSDAKYCGDAKCRMVAHRERQKSKNRRGKKR